MKTSSPALPGDSQGPRLFVFSERRFRGGAFTLIELLVVIGIIAILAALLFPAVNGALDSAKRAKAKNDVVQLAVAVKAYQTEYGRSPVGTLNGAGEHQDGWFQGPETSGQYNSEVVKVLMGENHKGLNPRKITFLEVRPAKGEQPKDGVDTDGLFYDPWGTPYAIKIDTEYDNWVEYYGQGSAENLRTTVIAISFGKNKIQQDISKATDKGAKVDDVVSFQ